MHCFTTRNLKTSCALAMTAIVCFALALQPASAQTAPGSFTLKISEKEMNLAHPSDMAWQKYIMWDLGFQRMNDRNMPYFELTNNASSTAPITQFRLTIGDTRFHFADDFLGDVAMLGSTTPGFNITSSTAGNLGDELIVDIGSGGLAPGGMLRFKVDLDVDAAHADNFFPHPDYRTVLFDMNGVNVYDGFLTQFSTADNAKAFAVFDPSSGANVTVGPVPLADEFVIGPEAQFFNDNYRRYNEMDPVRTFIAGGSDEFIPEPASALLAAIGLLSGTLLSTRRRRAAMRVSD